MSICGWASTIRTFTKLPKPPKPSKPSKPPKPSKPSKLSYNEQRELAALPDRIDALEKEIAAIEADLVAGKIYTSERLAPAQEELEQLVDRWAELEERKGAGRKE